METTGERIAASRRQLGISQSHLARRIGISLSTMAWIEKGETTPSGRVVELLAEALQVTADFLLGRTTADSSQKRKSGLSLAELELLREDIPAAAVRMLAINKARISSRLSK